MITKQKILIAFALAAAFASAATDISEGNVSGTWDLSGSPYVVQGNIRVAPGESLNIEAGVHVQFAGSHYLRILGNFNAEGGVNDSVFFEPENEDTYWSGLNLDSLYVDSDTAVFRYCSIKRMQNTGIRIIGTSKVVFDHCLIAESSQMYISAMYCSGGNPYINRTTFKSNTANSGSEGGAMYIWDASPVVRQCVFVNNYSPWSAGAVTVYRDDEVTAPEFDRCIFEDNTTSGSGGAVVLHSNTPASFYRCDFSGNEAGFNGGAIWSGYTQVSPIEFEECHFTSNIADDNGGACYLVDTKTNFTDCDFEGNHSTNQSGGAIYAYDENMIINLDHCLFDQNSAGSSGGGAHILDYSTVSIHRSSFTSNSANLGGGLSIDAHTDPVITSSLFANNTAHVVGGGVYSRLHSHPTYTNCTFANNLSEGAGGAMMLYWESDPLLTNCLFWGNVSEDGVSTYAVNDYIWNYCDAAFYNCIVEGGTSSMLTGTSEIAAYEACIELDPLFLSPTVGPGATYEGALAQWTLAMGSPGENAGIGTPESLGISDEDFFGNPRLVGESIDIGAYEGFYPGFNPEGDLNGDGFVSTADLLELLGGYGCIGPGCEMDLNGDGNTGAADILAFLGFYTG